MIRYADLGADTNYAGSTGTTITPGSQTTTGVFAHDNANKHNAIAIGMSSIIDGARTRSPSASS